MLLSCSLALPSLHGKTVAGCFFQQVGLNSQEALLSSFLSAVVAWQGLTGKGEGTLTLHVDVSVLIAFSGERRVMNSYCPDERRVRASFHLFPKYVSYNLEV